MANEPKSNSGEWQMPEPIFRSSEGKTPRAARGIDAADEIDTLSPDFSEADTDEIDVDEADQDEIDTETPDPEPSKTPIYEEQPPSRNGVRAVAQTQSGGCAKTVGVIAGTIAFSLIAIVFVIVYFLFFAVPSDSTF